MSIKEMSNYVFYSKYAKYDKDKHRRETWSETVNRVFAMHRTHLESMFPSGKIPEQIQDYLDLAQLYVKQKRVLGSQRALQFGGEPILKHNEKLFNCSAVYIDRVRAFQEVLYVLLCGCGVGFSVQKHHVAKLPNIAKRDKGKCRWVIEDSIEGWADALGVLMSSYFTSGQTGEFDESIVGKVIEFDYSKIRPEGSLISGGFLAPGPKGLKSSLEKIAKVIDSRLDKGDNKLLPIDVYDILMYSADAVLSGGVRRSACIALFSKDDTDMLNAKTGDWFIKNPQRGRSNNSVVIKRDECNREEFSKIINAIKQFGEPGFIFVDNYETLVNPCVEISFNCHDSITGETGFSFCNLCEINMKKCKTEEDFFSACKVAAFVGTIQASYNSFSYLTEATENIVKQEALIGVSMTGMMDSPDISFNPEIQRKGAKIIKKINAEIAELIGINTAARCTCVKPSGSASLVIGSASGIHPHHARRYLRRIQANIHEFPLQHFERINPFAVETSIWSNTGTDKVVVFPCEVPVGSVIKNQLSAIDLLEKVKLTQQNWVEYGTRVEQCISPDLRHNVSNTINVKPEEWEAVADFLYKNRKYFTGVSLLSVFGDKDLPQTPLTTIYTADEIAKQYGNASMMASGLIVHAHKAFDDNLWRACNCALGTEPYDTNNECQKTWIKRVNKFADRYFNGDVRRVTYLLKDVDNLKFWLDLNRQFKPIDWSLVNEPNPYALAIDTTAAAACAGGKCEVI